MSPLDQAIADVAEAMDAHARGNSAPFSHRIMANVLTELRHMQEAPDYIPSYPRFLLDWEDASRPLGQMLIEIAYQRGRAVKR